MASTDSLLRPMDAGANRIENVGTPTTASDATITDNATLPQNPTATAVAGASFIAASRDHVHQGVHSVHADANANLFGDVQLVSGTGITLSQSGNAVTAATSTSVRAAAPVRGFRIFSHSYADAFVGTGQFANANSNNDLWPYVLAGALGLPKERVTNHAVTGSQLTAVNAAQGWVQMLTALSQVRPPVQWPYTRVGECAVMLHGINDLGNNTSANQTKIVAAYGRALKSIISLHRSAAVYLCQAGTQWGFGANFSNAANATDFTMGSAKQATVVDSAGSSTATFTIPTGYHGEPICFNMVALTGGSLIVTWGGNITGTTSIVGRTDTLSGLTVNAQGAYPVRFTAATNGLTSANAGQTITVRITTVSGSTFYIDGAWIEATKPPAFIVCNCAKLPTEIITFACGDGVGNGTTTFTSASAAQFVSGTDAGQAIVETDAGGHIPGSTTITSVTNATTVVLNHSVSAGTAIQFTVARKFIGYNFYTTNTDFSGATVASHAAADTDVTNLNTEIANRVAEFGSMVQIADINTALGNGDTSLPAGQYTWFYADGLHPTEVGHEAIANAVLTAIYKLSPEEADSIGGMEVPGGTSQYPGSLLLPINNGGLYTTPYTSWNGTAYTAVAGDMFALPLFITQSSAHQNQIFVEQTNAPATAGSNVRAGFYFDHNFTGYPDKLWVEATSGGTVALGTTAGMKSLINFGRDFRYGLMWLVLKIDSLGTTASQLRQITGPSILMPNWVVAGGAVTPIAWKVTGQAAGALPNIFPTGGAVVSSAPAVGVTQFVLF